MPRVSQSNVSFDAHSIWLNWSGLPSVYGATAVLDVHFGAPPTVTITSPSILTNHPNQTISGTVDTVDAGSTVFIYDNSAGTPSGQATVDANGNWSASVTLVEGANILVAKDTNSAGTGTSSSITDTLLTKKPVVTITSPGGLTNNPGPTITGSVGAEGAGDTIRLYQSANLNDVTTAGADGSWSFSGDGLGADPTFPDGIYNVDITATDAAGNVGSNQISFNLDRTPPTATITSVLPVTGTKLTDLTGLTISGTTSEDGTIALDLFSATGTGPRHVTASAAASGGQWSVTLPAQPDNNYTAIVRPTDSAGNLGQETTLGFTVIHPAPPVATHGTMTVPLGHPTDITAAIANLVTPGTAGDTEAITAVSGSGASLTNGHVTFLDPTTTYDAVTSFSTASNPNGVWSYRAGTTLLDNNTQFPGYWTNGKNLPNTDFIGGNANYLRLDPQLNANATVQFTAQSTGVYTVTGDFLGVDPTEHAHKVEILVGDTSVYSNTIASHGQTDTFSLTEVLTAGETIRFISDTGAGGDYTNLSTGLQATITTPSAPGGSAEIGYTVTDENGSTASSTITVVTVPPSPAAPTISQETAAGFAATGQLTITGTAIAGSNVSLYDGGTAIGTAQADARGGYEVTLSSPLANGAHAIAATDTVNGQTSAQSVATPITIAPPPNAANDTVNLRPGQVIDVTSLINSLVTPGTAGDTENITSVSGPGAIFTNNVVTYSAPLLTYRAADSFSETNNPNGPWSYSTGGTTLTDNTRFATSWTNGGVLPHLVIIGAPNQFAPGYLRLDPQLEADARVNFNAPTAGIYTITGSFLGIDPTEHSHQVQISVGGVSTYSNTIASYHQLDTFSFTVALSAGERVSFASDTGPNGDFRNLSTGLEATITSPVNTSTQDITYTVTDEHGATATGTLTMVVVPAPVTPTAPAIGQLNPSGYSNTGLLTITGHAELGTTVSIYDGTTLLGTTAADPITGQYQFTPTTPLTDGPHSIDVTATNGSGTSQASSFINLIVDTHAPAMSEILAHDTSTSSSVTSNPALSGGGDPNATVTITEGSKVLGTTTADGTGAWSFTPTGLSQGAHTLTASETDAAGNTGSIDLGFTLDTTAPTVTAAQRINNLTNATSQVISGTVSDSNGVASVHVFEGNTDLGAATITGDVWTFTATGLAEGNHNFTAIATDTAGNETNALPAGGPITVDLTAPVVTLVSATSSISASPVHVTGTVTDAHSGTTVQVYADGGTNPAATAQIGTDGKWSADIALTGPGQHSLVASSTDLAGNTGSSAALIETLRGTTIVNLSGYNNTVDSPVTATLSNGLSGPAIAGPIFGNAATNGTPASETITATGLNNTITAGGGDDTIFAGLGQAHVTVSDADGDNTVTGSVGFTAVTLGNGNNTIALGGTGNTIKVGTGHNTIDAGIGSETIEIAGGTASVHAQGYYNVFNLAGGTTEITGLIGFATLNLGATFTGTDSVDLRGLAGDIFTFANGVGKLTKPDGELVATINAPTGQTLSAIDDGTDGLKIVLGTITPPPPPPATALEVLTETQWGVNITLADATKTVHLAGYNNTVTATSGNHTIDGDFGGLTLTLGSGDNKISVTGTGDTISLGVENGAFTGTGNNTVTGTLGSTTIHTGAGNQTISAGGYYNDITTGAGDSIINAGTGYSHVNTGDGHNDITAAGNQNTIITHNGDSTVTLNGWTNLIQAGAGHTLVSGGYFNTYEVTALGTKGGVEVTDFSTQYGDVLNLHDVFTLGDTIKVANGLSNDLLVSITHGTTTTQVADLHGLAGHSVADLIASHSLIT